MTTVHVPGGLWHCSNGPSAPRLYAHTDAGGRPFWSPTPPPGPGQGDGRRLRHPFYYSPMQVEEPPPDLAATRPAPSTPQRARQARSSLTACAEQYIYITRVGLHRSPSTAGALKLPLSSSGVLHGSPPRHCPILYSQHSGF